MPSNGGAKTGPDQAGGPPDQPATLADAILAAFEQACEAREYEVARRLLATLDKILAARPGAAGARQAQLASAIARLRAATGKAVLF